MKSKSILAAGIIIGAMILVCLTLAMPSLHIARIRSFPNTSGSPAAHVKALAITTDNPYRPQPPMSAIVLQSLERDLYGDGKTESLVLYLQNDENGYPASLHLTVDGTEKAVVGLDEGYTTGQLGFENLDRSRVADVLLYQCCTGSSGAQLLSVYRPSRGTWERLFAAPDVGFSPGIKRYSVKYIGDYQVYFQDKQTGLKSIIDLDRATHQNMADLLVRISNWVDPIADYKFTDIDGDRIEEIITVQRVIGINHPDTIAELRTTYKLESWQYRPITEALTTPGDPVTGAAKVLSEIHFLLPSSSP